MLYRSYRAGFVTGRSVTERFVGVQYTSTILVAPPPLLYLPRRVCIHINLQGDVLVMLWRTSLHNVQANSKAFYSVPVAKHLI